MLRTAPTCDFSIANAPFNVTRLTDPSEQASLAISEYTADVRELSEVSVFDQAFGFAADRGDAFAPLPLSDIAAPGRRMTGQIRGALQVTVTPTEL